MGGVCLHPSLAWCREGGGGGGAERADTPEHGLLLMCWVRTAVSEVLQSDSEAQLEQRPQTGGGRFRETGVGGRGGVLSRMRGGQVILVCVCVGGGRSVRSVYRLQPSCLAVS